jgi:hypothetical protein
MSMTGRTRKVRWIRRCKTSRKDVLIASDWGISENNRVEDFYLRTPRR